MLQRLKKYFSSGGKIGKMIGKCKSGFAVSGIFFFFLFSKKRCEADVAKCYHLLNTESECRLLLSFSLFSFEEFQS